ncbi:MAG: FKBP-type peptidyl-prolyl cis-trans isomerase [Litorimonas sp.]
MIQHKTLAYILGISAAALLSACGSNNDNAAHNEVSSETSRKASLEAVDSGAIINGSDLVTRCPDDKILASPVDYKPLVFAAPEGDYEGWHAKNGERQDVITTESGLQYKVAQKGLDNGASPVGGEVVTVHYHGYFPDGKVFDSSYERGSTIDFPANAVIRGWVESLQDMTTCEARTLYIPGDLAYGPQGRPGIPPNATLLFNVQMIGVTKN